MSRPHDAQPGTARRTLPRATTAVAPSTALGSGALISALHGSTALGVFLLASGQLWISIDLACVWYLRWRWSKLHEDIARNAMAHPDDPNLRNLLEDIASTHLDRLGARLPPRGSLTAAAGLEDE